MQQITVAELARRGDRLRIHCLDCSRQREIDPAHLVATHGNRLVSELEFTCSPCRARGQRGVGTKSPGRATWHEILWPDGRT
jgi:hypothetical protein